MGLIYRSSPPPRELAPWVECVWLLEGSLSPEGQTILPDGRRELIFHLGARPLMSGSQQPRTLIAGSAVAAVELQANQPLSVVGVRLRPEAEAGQGQLMDSMYGRWGGETLERVGNAETHAGRMEIVWDRLKQVMAEQPVPDAAIYQSIQLIERFAGRGPVLSFIPSGIGERQWQRRFRRACGYSPKTFARITRFQHLVALSKSGRPFAEIAFEAGFFDQAHLINEFKAFCGWSPESFFRSGQGMSEFYRDGFFQDSHGTPVTRSRNE